MHRMLDQFYFDGNRYVDIQLENIIDFVFELSQANQIAKDLVRNSSSTRLSHLWDSDLFAQRLVSYYICKSTKMAMGKIEDRIKKMKEAIQSEAKQRALQIVERAQEEADIERNNIIKEEKQKIDSQFSKLHKAEKVKAKIEKSSVVNHQRIRKMQERYRLVQQLREQLKQRLTTFIRDESRAKQITQNLIVQGMLRMMERNISIESTSSQQSLVQSLFENCQNQFSEIVRGETGKDLQVTLSLSEYSLEQKHKSIIGGIFLRSQDGLIVCDNSLDARVSLIFEQLLPEIRRFLFPKKVN